MLCKERDSSHYIGEADLVGLTAISLNEGSGYFSVG